MMADRVVTIHAKPVAVHPSRPETFGDVPKGVAIPPGTGGLVKVTSQDRDGPGTYLGFEIPPTSESATTRLVLPSNNSADEVRTYRTSGWLFGTVGTVAGSRTNELQLEVRNPEVLHEESRWHLPQDSEVRFGHAAAVAAGCAVVGLAVGFAFGETMLGLALGILIGFFIGMLWPTDWKDLGSLLFGAADVAIMLSLA